MVIQFLKKYKTSLLICSFGILFLFISFGKHFLFKSAALDLGVFNQAMFKLSGFQSPDITLVPHGKSYFRDHFAPILFLYIPLYKMLGVHSLLIIQVVALLAGAIGIFKLSIFLNGDKDSSYRCTLYYLVIWGIYSALWFDFHNIVVGAALLPWLMYFLYKERLLLTVLIYATMLMAKENISLWLAFVMLASMLVRKSEIVFYKRIEFFLMIISLTYFVIIVSVVMPHISGTDGNAQLNRYDHLGVGLFDIVKNLISNPIKAVGLLFGSFSQEAFSIEIIKLKFWIVFLISGGFMFLYKPKLLIMLIPIIGQKMLANDAAFWGPHNQYSIEFVPVFSFLFVFLAGRILNKTKQYVLIGLAISITFFVVTDKYKHWFENNASNIIISTQEIDVSVGESIQWEAGSIFDIYSGLATIPKGAAVSATSTLVPHIANRDKIYMFPKVLDADYIALHNTNNTYPITKWEYTHEIETILAKGIFHIIYNRGGLIILQKANK
nr:DUF2079 domain-containing protein [uncultured Carboxylicivirga sp.]